MCGSTRSFLRVSSPADRRPLGVLDPGQPSAPSSTGTWFSGHTSQPGRVNYRGHRRCRGETCMMFQAGPYSRPANLRPHAVEIGGGGKTLLPRAPAVGVPRGSERPGGQWEAGEGTTGYQKSRKAVLEDTACSGERRRKGAPERGRVCLRCAYCRLRKVPGQVQRKLIWGGRPRHGGRGVEAPRLVCAGSRRLAGEPARCE